MVIFYKVIILFSYNSYFNLLHIEFAYPKRNLMLTSYKMENFTHKKLWK